MGPEFRESAALGGLVTLIVLAVAFTLSRRSRQPFSGVRTQSKFECRFSSPSLAVFEAGCQIRLVQVSLPGGSADIHLSTGYLEGWGPVEHGVCAAIQGKTNNPDVDAGALSQTLSDLCCVLSVSANAWIGDPIGLGSAQAQPDLNLDQLRKIDEGAAGAVLDRLACYSEAETLREVMQSYRSALTFWHPEQQSLALMHLYSGLTAMSELVVDHLMRSRGLNRSSMAKLLGVPETELPARILESELCRDDLLCLHACRMAVTDPGACIIEDAHLSAARYLRAAILRVLELDAASYSCLLADPYDVPCGLGVTNSSLLQVPQPSVRLLPITQPRSDPA